MFVLLGQTSEINSPKNKYDSMNFLFYMLEEGDPPVQRGGGIPRGGGYFCRNRECVHFVGAN